MPTFGTSGPFPLLRERKRDKWEAYEKIQIPLAAYACFN